MKAKISILIVAVISCSMTLHAVKLTFSNEIIGKNYSIAIVLCDEHNQCHGNTGVTIARGSQKTIDTDDYPYKGRRMRIQVVGLLLASEPDIIDPKKYNNPTTFHIKLHVNEGTLAVTE